MFTSIWHMDIHWVENESQLTKAGITFISNLNKKKHHLNLARNIDINIKLHGLTRKMHSYIWRKVYLQHLGRQNDFRQ